MDYGEEIQRRREILSGVEDSSISDGDGDSFNNESPSIMSVVWAAGKLAVSIYDLDTSIISLLLDIVESAPDFMVLKLIYNQYKPGILIVSARQDERMLKVLRELCSANLLSLGEESIDGPGQNRTKLIVLPGREFAPDSCKKRVRELTLPFETKSNDEKDHTLFISTLIPSNSPIIFRSLGALLKFLDKKGVDFQQVELDNGKVPVLDIISIKMDEIVIIDETAWSSLQIFHLENHPSNYKAGTASAGAKEGLSLYGVLNKCESPQGSKFLRSMLLRPTRNKNILKRRHDVVEFFAKQINSEFVRNAIESLKGIKSFPKHLFKLSVMRSTVREWKDLYTSLYQCVILGDFCGSFTDQLELFTEISEFTSKEEFKQVVFEIQKVIDFESSTTKGHIVTQTGIFEELDRKKQQYACLPEVMTMVAGEEMNLLPEFVLQCSVVYFPEVGYLLSLSFDRELTEEDLREIQDMEYQFSSNDVSYFKSARMKELDIILGDCQISILDIEISIIVNLTNFVLKRSELILKIGQLISELDSLIAMAKVAQTYNYVRPLIVDGHRKLKIVNGRHPLCELCTNFVPNSTIFESDEKVVILTGPNASGKSIYLKQIGIIIIMALSGSFVPAASALIPTFDRICTRIHACESVANGFSTFMIDLAQMGMALRNTSENSLVLIDEFGKGTADTDGLSLLAASFEEFLNRNEACPRILLSTHFFSLLNHLVESPQIKLQTMNYTQQNNTIIYLYKLQNGTCSTSFAHLVAESFDIDKKIVDRSLEMADAIKKQLDEDQIKPADEEKCGYEEDLTNLALDFKLINLEDRPFLFNVEETMSNSIVESPVSSRYFNHDENEASDLENLTSASPPLSPSISTEAENSRPRHFSTSSDLENSRSRHFSTSSDLENLTSTSAVSLPPQTSEAENSRSAYFSTSSSRGAAETGEDMDMMSTIDSEYYSSVSFPFPHTILSTTTTTHVSTTNESNVMSTEVEVIEP